MPMKLIIGLGNPGEKYHNTRHNLGFEVLEEFRKKLKAPEWTVEKKFKAEVSKASLDLLLIRPLTFMNQSGKAVAALKNFYKIEPEEIVVVHDELDLLLGHMKVRQSGGAGGHHGVESIISDTGTDKFIRVRLGIGNDRSFSGERKRVSFEAERFVLEEFLPKEHSQVKSMFKKAVSALDTILKKGVETAQNQFN